MSDLSPKGTVYEDIISNGVPDEYIGQAFENFKEQVESWSSLTLKIEKPTFEIENSASDFCKDNADEHTAIAVKLYSKDGSYQWYIGGYVVPE